MNNWVKCALGACLALIVCLDATATTKSNRKKTLLVIDTTQRDPYLFANPLAILAERHGYSITYAPISEIVDTPLPKLMQHTADFAFFLCEPTFLLRMNDSPIARKVLALIEHFSHVPTTAIGLFLSPKVHIKENALYKLAPLVARVGLPTHAVTDEHTDLFSQALDAYLGSPLEHRATLYHTSLRPPRENVPFKKKLLSTLGIRKTHTLYKATNRSTCFLPMNTKADPRVSALFPLAVYHHNPNTNNHLLVASSTVLLGLSASENFQFCPTDFTLRAQILDSIDQMLAQFIHLVTTKKEIKTIGQTLQNLKHTTLLPTPHALLGFQLPGNASANRRSKKIAWMDLKLGDKQDRNKIVDSIIDAQLDSIWLTISPNTYYATHAIRATEKEAMLKAVSAFTGILVQKCTQKNFRLPKILISFEISNNYKKKLPTTETRDVYGVRFSKCPCPLDSTFWQEEVARPLKLFARDWVDVGNGIPLGGIVLDLEMYFAKPSMFVSTMGFSPDVVSSFTPHLSHKPPRELSQIFEQRRLMTPYFAHLEKQAYGIGTFLKEKCQEILPDCSFGCYLPNISLDWFYKGLYQGLSQKTQPLMLLTFNTEFDAHRTWFADNNINVQHSGVLMLSKLQQTGDSKEWVDYLTKHHSSFWINRFSRLAQPYEKGKWFTLEHTPIDESGKKQFLDVVARS